MKYFFLISMLMFLSCSATDKIYNTDAQNISEPDSIIVENSDYKINEETFGY